MLFANCHNHSTFSDGVYTPEEIIDLAKKLGHKAMILTDHDTVRGTYFFEKAARLEGILTLLGCEFSVIGPNGEDIHLLGIDFNPDNAEMQKLLANGSGKQRERTHLLFDWGLERGSLRPGVTWQDVLDRFPYNDYICNNQVFTLMMERGIYTYEEYPEFFNGTFKPDPQTRQKLREQLTFKVPPIDHVIRVIKDSGGVPVVAHPNTFSDIAEDLIKLGVMGFETRHPLLTDEEKVYFDELCTKNYLYKLGGTDHSSILGGYADRIENLNVPPETGYVEETDFMRLYKREHG